MPKRLLVPRTSEIRPKPACESWLILTRVESTSATRRSGAKSVFQTTAFETWLARVGGGEAAGSEAMAQPTFSSASSNMPTYQRRWAL